MSFPSQARTRESIEAGLFSWIARELGLPPEALETSESLLNYSLSSVTAMMLVGDLEEWMELTLPPTMVWDYPSISAIANALLEQSSSRSADVREGGVTAGGKAIASDLLGRLGAGADPLLSLDGLSDQEVDALLSQMIADESAGASP